MASFLRASLRVVVASCAAAVVPGAALLFTVATSSCSHSSGAQSADAAIADQARLDEPIVIRVDSGSLVPVGDAGTDADGGGSGGCTVVIDSPPLQPAQHVAIGTDVQYDSNPPSSGPHYPIWAAFQEFTTPVDRRYYVHDLEHGAVVFVYNCALLPDGGVGTGDGGSGGECDAIVQALRNAVAAIPDDPLCTSAGEGVRVRAVITPDPLLDVPLAAAAWGWTYRATCIDPPSLATFAQQHYGQGPEQFCTNGQTQF